MTFPTWQPIATAPKSDDINRCQYILGFIPNDAGLDRQTGITVIWWEPHMRDHPRDPRGKWMSDNDVPIKPTHWMPLPKAPEKEV